MSKNKLEKDSQVYQLRNRGLSYADVAAYLSITVDKAKKLYEQAQKKHIKSQQAFKKDKFVVSSLVTFDDIMAQAWKDYEALTGSDKIKALSLIKEVNNDKIKFIKDLEPSVKKSGKNVQEPMIDGLPGNNPSSALEGWTEELKKLAATTLLESTLKTELKEPTLDTNTSDSPLDPPKN